MVNWALPGTPVHDFESPSLRLWRGAARSARWRKSARSVNGQSGVASNARPRLRIAIAPPLEGRCSQRPVTETQRSTTPRPPHETADRGLSKNRPEAVGWLLLTPALRYRWFLPQYRLEPALA